MDREGRHDSIRFFNISSCVFIFDCFYSYDPILATSNVYNNTEQSQSRQPASNDLSSSSVTTDKNTTDFLITLSSTQNTYTRKTEILGIGAGNWAIVANGTVVKNNPLDNKSSVSGVVVDFTAVQGYKNSLRDFSENR